MAESGNSNYFGEQADIDAIYHQDVVLIQEIAHRCGLPKVYTEAFRKESLQELEHAGVPVEKIIKFVERALSAGWLKIGTPFGYNESPITPR